MPGSEEGPRPAWRVLIQRNFLPYFVGGIISNSGTWIQVVAQAVLIFRLTGSTFLVSMVAFMQFLGVVVLAPFTGAAADRFDRKRLLVVTQLISAAAAGVLVVANALGQISVALILAIALIVGIAKAFSVPALHSLIPGLVEKRDLQSAIALNAITFNLARAIGPVVAAAVIATAGFTAAFIINSASYLALVAGLAMVKVRTGQARSTDRPKLRDTIHLVRADPRLVALMGSVAAVSISIDPIQTLTPAFAVNEYLRDDTFAGIMVGVFGAGAVVAALLVTKIPPRRKNVALTMLGLGAGVLALALLPDALPGLAVLLVAGGSFLAAVIVATTIIQTIASEEHRGRIMAIWSVAYFGFRPPAALIDGLVAELAGVRVAAAVLSLPALIGGLILWSRPWNQPPGDHKTANSQTSRTLGM
jgi:MFS family permease